MAQAERVQTLKGRPKTFDQKRRKGFNPALDVPVTILSKVPKAPKRFTREMCQTWKITAQELIVNGLLTVQSLIPLEIYCYAVANVRAANRDKKANFSTRTAANKECRVAAEMLGLTPMAHSKMKRPMAATPVDSADDQTFAELVN